MYGLELVADARQFHIEDAHVARPSPDAALLCRFVEAQLVPGKLLHPSANFAILGQQAQLHLVQPVVFARIGKQLFGLFDEVDDVPRVGLYKRHQLLELFAMFVAQLLAAFLVNGFHLHQCPVELVPQVVEAARALFVVVGTGPLEMHHDEWHVA